MCVRQFYYTFQHLVYLCGRVGAQRSGKFGFCCQVVFVGEEVELYQRQLSLLSRSCGKYNCTFIIFDIYSITRRIRFMFFCI